MRRWSCNSSALGGRPRQPVGRCVAGVHTLAASATSKTALSLPQYPLQPHAIYPSSPASSTREVRFSDSRVQSAITPCSRLANPGEEASRLRCIGPASNAGAQKRASRSRPGTGLACLTGATLVPQPRVEAQRSTLFTSLALAGGSAAAMSHSDDQARCLDRDRALQRSARARWRPRAECRLQAPRSC